MDRKPEENRNAKRAMAVLLRLFNASGEMCLEKRKNALTRRMPPGCAPAQFRQAEPRPRDVDSSSGTAFAVPSTTICARYPCVACQNTSSKTSSREDVFHIREPRAVGTVGIERASVGVRRREYAGQIYSTVLSIQCGPHETSVCAIYRCTFGKVRLSPKSEPDWAPAFTHQAARARMSEAAQARTRS